MIKGMDWKSSVLCRYLKDHSREGLTNIDLKLKDMESKEIPETNQAEVEGVKNRN